MSSQNNWFERGFVPEGEDLYHKKAVEQAIVPEGCLQGGSAIWTFFEKGIDICQLCPWPRSLCHGRPQRKDGVIETRFDDTIQPDASSGAVRNMTFQLWVSETTRQFDEKPKKEKKR